MKKILMVLLSLALLFSCCGAFAEAPRKLESPTDADDFVAAFFGEHPEEMNGAWALSAQMESALAAYGGISGLAAQFAPLGTLLKVDPAYEGEIQGFKAFFVPCVFSVTSADLILIVQDGAIAGLSTGAYSGGKDKPFVVVRMTKNSIVRISAPGILRSSLVFDKLVRAYIHIIDAEIIRGERLGNAGLRYL